MGKNISSFILGAIASVSMAQPASADGMAWDGLYAGVHSEYLWGEPTLSGPGASTFLDGEVEGWAGGLTGGYNHVAGDYLFGVEADIALSDADGSAAYNCCSGIEGLNVELDWLSTVRGRVGFAQDNFLVFATGGVAFGGLEGNYFGTVASPQALDATAAGYTLGAGIEMLVHEQVSLKAEYLYVDLANEDLDFVNFFDINSAGLETSLIKVGMNWHFQP